MRKLLPGLFAGLALAGLAAGPASAKMPSVALYKQFVESRGSTGWVLFQELADRQLVNFIPLVALTCGIAQVRYSVNSDALDRSFALPPCDREYLFHAPFRMTQSEMAVVLEPGTARSVSVQVTFTDGTQSAVRRFVPCAGVARGACARVAD